MCQSCCGDKGIKLSYENHYLLFYKVLQVQISKKMKKNEKRKFLPLLNAFKIGFWNFHEDNNLKFTLIFNLNLLTKNRKIVVIPGIQKPFPATHTI